MEPEQVDMLLASYKINKGRSGHLSMAIREKEAQYQRMKAVAAADLLNASHSALTEYTIPGTDLTALAALPKGNTTGDPTGNMAIKLADGYETDEMRALRKEIINLRADHERVSACVIYVDAWLDGLLEREAWVVRQQIIEARIWNDVVSDYMSIYRDSAASKTTLKRIKANAMEKIYKMAQ